MKFGRRKSTLTQWRRFLRALKERGTQGMKLTAGGSAKAPRGS
jgi:hypothetical protein